MPNSILISLYTTNLLMHVKTFLLVNTHASNQHTLAVLLMIYALLSLPLKRQTQILYKCKSFLPIGAITNTLSAYSQRDCRDNREDNKSCVAKKRCFVCNKKACWSSKHTREEYEDLKNKLKEWFS